MEFDEFRLKPEELQVLRKDWDRTHIDVTPFKFQWTLNTRNCFEDSNLCVSPAFITSSKFGKSEWHLRVLSHLDGEYKIFELYLLLKSTTNKEHKVAAKYSFGLLNYQWEKSNVKKVDLHKMDIDKGFGFDNYINEKTLFDKQNKLIVKNNVTIVCEGCIADSGLDIFGSVQLEIPKPRMSDDFVILLDSGMFSDVTITVSEREFKVHKAILASRSTVFEALFSPGMAEIKTDKVVIDDIEEDVFEELLRFIYTGNTLNLEKVSDRLLIAADKYALQRLKLMCEQDLINNVSIENAGSFYKLAYIYNAKELKLKVFDFLSEHKLDVIKSNDWKCLTQTHPELVIEALQLIITNNP